MTSRNHQFGFEWAHELEEGISGHLDQISCMEIIPENFFEGRFAHFLQLLREKQVPVAVHGVLLSIGSMEPLKVDHMKKVIDVSQGLNVSNYSEHLSLTEIGDVNLDALTPLAWTQETADHVCRKIEQIQKMIDKPFLIENVSNRFIVPDADFSETEFINFVLSRTDCGLLLDVTNVYTNSRNFNYDPQQWLDEIELSKVQLVHLAGGVREPDGFLMDSHDNAIEEGSWELYRYVCERAPAFMTIIERTGNFPDFQNLAMELETAKNIAQKTQTKANPVFESVVQAQSL